MIRDPEMTHLWLFTPHVPTAWESQEPHTQATKHVSLLLKAAILLAAAVLALVIVASAHGQVSGRGSGTVHDATRAVVPRSLVPITNVVTAASPAHRPAVREVSSFPALQQHSFHPNALGMQCDARRRMFYGPGLETFDAYMRKVPNSGKARSRS